MLNPLSPVIVLGELAASLRVLPELLEELRDVRSDTRRMADNTDSLPEVREALAEVAKATRVLPRMDERMAHIEEAMPVLVEVQQHLARLPETIRERLRDAEVSLRRQWRFKAQGTPKGLKVFSAEVG